MIFWIKDSKNNTIKIEDTKWNNYFYLASNNTSNLEQIGNLRETEDFIKKTEYVYRYEKITDDEKSKVLKIYTQYIASNVKLANIIERKIVKVSGEFRLYNIDLLPVQHYFYEHDLFPCGTFDVEESPYGLFWKVFDDDCVSLTDYIVPNFRNIYLKINFQKGGIPRLSDKLKHITITTTCDKEPKINIQSESEDEIIIQLSKIVKKLDPDIIITENGDSFLFPYLIHRASENNLDLVLGRDSDVTLKKPTRNGVSYFSYGRTYYKPSSVRFYGRCHIDTSSSFLWRETQDIHGLVEISRLSRLPLHETSRATIGKCLTSFHLYNATKKGILVPWKPTMSEYPKTLRELFIADRGGLILEPEIGVHEKVAEFDFVSLYPNIIYKKNISAETILCQCCYLDSDNKIPELNYHICKRKEGLIPKSLELVLKKRLHYKQLKKITLNDNLKKIYNTRQSALKWILVTSFGYLGFSNAKFGRIDAHIAVCAFARNILLESVKIAEELGFEVLHGIVDSIWIKKENATKNDYIQLKNSIEERTGFEISFEGIYKWIAFLSSEQDNHIPVTNRYFGVFEDGTLKMRGIETRRHDTPLFLSNFQQNILEILASANNRQELRQKLSEIHFLYKKYLLLLRERKVSIEDLIFTKQLSKNYNEYENRNTIENNVLKILTSNKEFPKAGQLLKYVITYYPRRKAIPLQLVDDQTRYDINRYSELLADIYDSIVKIIN